MIIIEILFLVFFLAVIFSLILGFIGNPFVPTSKKVVKKMVENAELEDGLVVYDLG